MQSSRTRVAAALPVLSSPVRARKAQLLTPRRHLQQAVCKRDLVAVRVASIERPAPASESPEPSSSGAIEDPWEDEKWTQYKWTVYRGVAYDLTPILDRHPGGRWLLNLSIGRDCTALFESYHLRPDVAANLLKRVPQLENFPIAAVPLSPRPNDSELYNAIRNRVRTEVFKGEEAKGAHRSGSEWAALAVLGYSALAWTVYATAPGVLTGFALGLAGAWIGLTVQHCGNHGAMSTNPTVNTLMGLGDDLVGGSSLMWRYHHQVSHHIHCNDDALDEDVFSAFPALRFDPRLPKMWYHQFQHIYMWFTFPLLQLGFQFSDIYSLVVERTPGASLYGASPAEKSTVILGKIAHYSLLLFIPAALHGWQPTLAGAAAYVFTQGVILATTFSVSHNIPETKPEHEGAELVCAQTEANLIQPYDTRDWAAQQVLTSANWGGVIGNFFTGGLNLQIEHHLFPAISFMHYPAISKIVASECEKRGVQYTSYTTLPEIITRFYKYMKEAGSADHVDKNRGGLTLAEVRAHQHAAVDKY